MTAEPVRIEGDSDIAINGVRLRLVAAIIGGMRLPAEPSGVELAIAKRVKRKGEQALRHGYKPELVTSLVKRWIQEEAMAVRVRKAG